MGRKLKNEEEAPSVPLFLQLPPEFLAEFNNRKKINEKELSFALTDLRKGLNLVTTTLAEHRAESTNKLSEHKKNVDQIEKELKDAFKVLWPKFDEINKEIKKRDSELDSKHKDHEANLSKHSEQITSLSEEIIEISKTIEKRYQSALKKINQQKDKVEVREGRSKRRKRLYTPNR
jgi:chromosome segregation ATPase